MSFLYEECSLCELKDSSDITTFCSGDKDLDDFFANDCLAYAKQLLGKTYFYKLKSDSESVVCAFH